VAELEQVRRNLRVLAGCLASCGTPCDWHDRAEEALKRIQAGLPS